jgi:UDP-N-acetylmuramoylalanine--D-glutamate ligase
LEAFVEPEPHDVAVLELSSFQLDLAGDFRPDIGLFLNLSPDHLDRHGSMKQYTAAKMQLFSHQNPDDLAVFGSDDAALETLAATVPARVETFGHRPEDRARIVGSRIRLVMEKQEEWFELADTRLASGVGRLNAAAALLGAAALVEDPAALQKGLASFRPAEHRMTPVATVDGVRFINDSKATNPGSMQAAIASCPGKVVLIAGGQAKGADFLALGPVIAEKVRHMLVMGEAAGQLHESFAPLVPVVEVADMDMAVRRGFALAREGDTVLLAPGCASFDMFSDYGHRGRVFSRSVLSLKKKSDGESDHQQGERA